MIEQIFRNCKSKELIAVFEKKVHKACKIAENHLKVGENIAFHPILDYDRGTKTHLSRFT